MPASRRASAGAAVFLLALISGCGPNGISAPEAGSTAEGSAPESSASSQVLSIGEPVEGDLSRQRPARFHFDLHSDEATVFTLEQTDVDLEARVLDAAGRLVGGFDGPYGTEAPERVCFVAPEAGTYSLELRPFGPAAGRFRVVWDLRRPATQADQLCATAAERFMAAEKVRLERNVTAELAREYEQIHQLWMASGHPFLATVALRQAGISWRTLGASVAAQKCYGEALEQAQQIGDPYLEISLSNDLGQVFRDRREYVEAQTVFEKALLRARSSGLLRLQASSLNNLALVDERTGRWHRAMERLREAAEIQGRFEPDQQHAQIRINLARVYTVLEHHEEALEILSEAAEIARRKGDAPREAAALTSIGWLQYLRGQPRQGVSSLQDALKLFREMGDRRWELGVLDRLGTVLAAAGNLDEAAAAYLDSLAISSQFDYAEEAAFTKVNLACLYPRLGRLDDALELLAEARSILQGIEDTSGLSFLEFCQAKAARETGDLDAALLAIERARERVDDLRSLARQRGERFRPIPLWQDFAELQLHLLIDKARRDRDSKFEMRALELIDLARARSLFELVLEAQLGVRSRAAPQLLAREREVQERLNAVAARATNGAQRPTRLAELTRQLERVRAEIRAADPYHERLVAPSSIDLDAVRACLDDESLLLRYVMTDERTYLFILGADHWKVLDLPMAPELEPQIQRFYEGLRQSSIDAAQPELAAHFLGRALLPVDAIPPGTRRLLIVADGSLHYLPFATLASPFASDGTSARWLIDDFEVLNLPSVALLSSLADSEPKPIDSVAVFADAVFSQEDERLTGESEPTCGSQTRDIGLERLPEGALPRLPCTRGEAERLLELSDKRSSHAAFGFDANKEAVLSLPLDRYQVLNFATHAFIDERFPELSGLVLSRLDSQGNPRDGDLYLHEIYGLRLSAELVALSGCQTALGRKVRGNGLLSMARGFLYAGSSRVLVSLWSVHDEATADLMGRFYEALLRDGESPTQALRTAQLWMKRQDRWQAPYYWAAFMLQGRP